MGPVSWTNLAATAAAGSTTITVRDAVYDGHAGWATGDHIVIASTDYFDHTEVRDMVSTPLPDANGRHNGVTPCENGRLL